jgi:hypothetical protein
MKLGLMVAVGALLCSGTPTLAARPKSSDRVLQEFGSCRTKADAAARLACFETTFDALEKAVNTKEVTIVDKADMREARRSLFGFTLPKIDLFGGSGDARSDPDDFTEINTTIASARPVDRGRVEIRLADNSGAVWQTTDPMNFPPKPGDKIRIRQGALGNYFLATGGRSYRGMRLR